MVNQFSDIRDLSPEELKSFFIAHKEKPFRGRQVFDWLWKKINVPLFEEMTDIPKICREMLNSNFNFSQGQPGKNTGKQGWYHIKIGLQPL